ncbi:hypothetical protein KUTeg_015752, partial [Tegillarca granosa]
VCNLSYVPQAPVR